MASHPLFAELPRAELRRLACHVDEADLAPGDVLMREGRYQRGLYLLLEGAVELHAGGRTVRTLGPGQWVGERSIRERKPARASAVVRHVGRALVMSRDQVRALTPELWRRLYEGGAEASGARQDTAAAAPTAVSGLNPDGLAGGARCRAADSPATARPRRAAGSNSGRTTFPR
jgi:CRP-like cAMP-binding protein